MKFLSRADEILLIAIWRLGENAYGVPIIKAVEKRTGKKLTFGSLWVSLDSLCKKGMLQKSIADPTPERGGRGKIYYLLTPEGAEALEVIREMQGSLWDGLPNNLKKMV